MVPQRIVNVNKRCIMSHWGWWDVGGAIAMILGVVIVINSIREGIIRCRKLLDNMQERRHARRMEAIDKEIALLNAREAHPEVPPCGPTQ
jgi:hypothetical protein